MKKVLFSLLVVSILSSSFTSSSYAEDLADMSLEDLMKVKLTTPSKQDQTLAEATNVATVITRREIQNSGAITLFDVLKRVPGFFPTHQATWDVETTRGLPADSTDHILLLIDGHPQNSIIGQGFQEQDQIPTLENVERIEVIRGPDSVLWGSSAALGMINVITQKNISEPRITVEVQNNQQLDYLNYVNGIGGSGGAVKGMYSISVWHASGYRYTQNNESAVAFPWGTQPTNWGGTPSTTVGAPWPAINHQREGVELYTRIDLDKDTEVYARLLKTSFNYVWDEFGSPNNAGENELGNRRAYLGIRKTNAFGDRFTLHSNVYGDYNLQNRDPLTLFNPNQSTSVQDQTNEEFALGIEELGVLKISDSNSLKMGAKYVRTDIGVDRDTRLNPQTNMPIASATGTTSSGSTFSYNLPYMGMDPGVDNTISLYAEDTQEFGNTTVFAGGRADWNDYRELGTLFLPRAGIVQRFSNNWVGKYTFNTGHLRPSAVYSKTRGIIVDANRGGAFPITQLTQSESVQSHDIQLSYTSEKTYGALTLFYMQVTNFASFDATDVPQGYRNLGDAHSSGIEFEAKQGYGNSSLAYLNFSYAIGKISNSAYEGALTDATGSTLNYPELMANIGTDWNPLSDHTLNVNFRGWGKMPYVGAQDQVTAGQGSPAYGTLGSEFYLDLNYSIHNALLKGLNFNAFISNVLDNQDRIGMVCNNGTYRPLGRTLGLRLSYSL